MSLELNDGERTLLEEMHSLSTDARGREVFAGLTLEESIVYRDYCRALLTEDWSRNADERETCLRLHSKHQRARRAVRMAENQEQADTLMLH
jgi:hypothetical protein